MMADPSKDLWDAASPAMVLLLSQSRQLAEQLQVRSAALTGPEGLGNPEDPDRARPRAGRR